MGRGEQVPMDAWGGRGHCSSPVRTLKTKGTGARGILIHEGKPSVPEAVGAAVVAALF